MTGSVEEVRRKVVKRHHATAAWAAWAVAGVILETVTLYLAEEGSTLSSHVWDSTRQPHRIPRQARCSRQGF